MILAGDIGGTNTRLALFETGGAKLTAAITEVFPSRAYKGLEEPVWNFLASHNARVEAASFGIAGPVLLGRCQASNLPWVVEADSLAQTIGLSSVGLVNDLEANAHGIALLDPSDFCVLQNGAANPLGNRALIAAGTGLGEAGLLAVGDGHVPFACEGGHCDFAPRGEVEMELLRYLMGRFGRVSYERVLSGPGLYNIYEFFRDTGRGTESAALAEEIQVGNPPAIISMHALNGTSELCEMALDQFVSFYGAEAGNLALKMMATGGVFLGGGIAPRILPKLMSTTFAKAFADKGRLSPVLEAIPVRVILNDKTALLGAASLATSAVARRQTREHRSS